MVKVIYGPKGSGKTKRVIKDANDSLDVCKGSIVYICDTPEYSKDVKNEIRFINIADYGDFNGEKLSGFICGIMASNTDVKRIYIDGTCRITGINALDIEELVENFDSLSDALSFDLILTITADKLPASLKKYAI